MTDDTSIAWQPKRVAIIGVGLLGGSVALAVREHYPQAVVVGSSRSADTRDYLVEHAIVSQAFESATQCVAGCDLIIIASPVAHIASTIPTVAAVADSDAVITDVGSTKQDIVAAAEADPEAASRFVGSHPIAGSEKTGAKNAIVGLFSGKLTLTTPTTRTDKQRHANVQKFWQTIGCRVAEMSPQEHDRAMAAASHMPHLVAAALAQTLPQEFTHLVGTGFQDATRIAAGDPTMWRQIVQANARQTLEQIDCLIKQLDRYRASIITDDWDGFEELLAVAQKAKWAIEK